MSKASPIHLSFQRRKTAQNQTSSGSNQGSNGGSWGVVEAKVQVGYQFHSVFSAENWHRLAQHFWVKSGSQWGSWAVVLGVWLLPKFEWGINCTQFLALNTDTGSPNIFGSNQGPNGGHGGVAEAEIQVGYQLHPVFSAEHWHRIAKNVWV